MTRGSRTTRPPSPPPSTRPRPRRGSTRTRQAGRPHGTRGPRARRSRRPEGSDDDQGCDGSPKASTVTAGRDTTVDRRSGHGPEGPFQGAEQHASTDQDAHSSATSEQFLPVNVNAPIQILSLGHNGGDTKQSNDSTAQVARRQRGQDLTVGRPGPGRRLAVGSEGPRRRPQLRARAPGSVPGRGAARLDRPGRATRPRRRSSSSRSTSTPRSRS